MRFITLLISSIAICFTVQAQEVVKVDSVRHVVDNRNLYHKVIDYFANSNSANPSKAFDVSFIGGPQYSTDTKFGIGLVAAGLYRHDRADTLIQPSNVSLYLDATTSMFFKVGIRGTHFFPGDKSRLSYDTNFESVKSKFWGIGYDNAINDANESIYKFFAAEVKADYGIRVAQNFYVGPEFEIAYFYGRDFQKPELLDGQSRHTFNLGVGFTIQYDNRDNVTCTQRGVYAKFNQQFNPRGLGNIYHFGLSELTLSGFTPVWRGGVLAANVHARLTYGDTPWGLMSSLGGSNIMRGYFEGRYRDKSVIDACLELRQHVWHRNGVVAWVGAASIFPEFSALRWRKVLPNYGIGYRWEFKRFVNIRLDLGFGRHQTGFIFSIDEAF